VATPGELRTDTGYSDEFPPAMMAMVFMIDKIMAQKYII